MTNCGTFVTGFPPADTYNGAYTLTKVSGCLYQYLGNGQKITCTIGVTGGFIRAEDTLGAGDTAFIYPASSTTDVRRGASYPNANACSTNWDSEGLGGGARIF